MQPHVTDLDQLLQQLPARVLLDRMPGPVLGVGYDGVVAYANPAVSTLLGHRNAELIGTSLPSLLVAHEHSSATSCVAGLRAAGCSEVVDWCHADGFVVHTAVSTPLLLRKDDPYLMVYITDVTELHWN